MKTKQNNGANKSNEILSKEEVWDVLEFARNVAGSGIAGMPLSPELLNQKLKDLSLLATGEVTESDVSAALLSPKDNELELQRQSQSFEITSPLYKRLISYLGNVPAFDWTYVCTNATAKDYSKSAYKKDLDVVRRFMDSFNVKSELRRVARQLMRNEAYFSVFRDEGSKYVLQELPPDRVKITGRWDMGILFSFDYTYFLQGGVDIDMYPPVFKKSLNALYGEGASKSGYNPSHTIGDRGQIGFAQWVDCSPVDGFWAFKLTPEIITRIPYFAGMFPDLVKEGVIRALQESSYMSAAVKIIMGQVPMLDARAKVKDMISISPELLGKFLALVQSAIDSSAVRVAASPLENATGFDFKADTDIRSSSLRTNMSSSGVSANLLFSGDVKATSIEAQLSLAVDEMLMTSIYPQFENFLDYEINKRTKKYKFKTLFEGTNFYTDRKIRLDNAKALSELGMVMPQKFAAAVGMSPFDMERQMEDASASGWVERLTPITPSYQKSKEQDAGRPTLSDDEIGDAGSQTRDVGSNDDKKA